MKTIYLLRHAAIADHYRGRFVGQIDPPLSPAGRLDAARSGRLLRRIPIDAIHCSDLQRARQTVALIAGARSLPVHARPELREIALGAWEGMQRSEVAARYPQDYAKRGADLANHRVPDGESFADCQKRMLKVWREIVASDAQRVVVVSHAGAIRALLCHLLGRPLRELFSIAQDYGAINVVACESGSCNVLRINCRAGELVEADGLPRTTPRAINERNAS